ncbi:MULTISPECIES: AzlD family protein [unclassified Variovorax]|uniref:AzlD family protein n=1 Tax=unclassified Variovorax TaxID=663243 RepID=UPI003F44AF96
MTFHVTTLEAIVAMAVVTYLTRVVGMLVMRWDRFSVRGRAKAALDAIPPVMFVTIIAPTLLVTGWPETLAGLLAAAASVRLPLLGTILVGVVAVAVLRLGLGVPGVP